MSLFDASILGLVQGITEFVPVSSSGHLIFVREILGLQASASDLSFDAVLQLATALAVIAYFRKDLTALARSVWNLIFRGAVEPEQKTLFFALVIGTIPAVIAGLMLESYMETVFRSSMIVAWTLLAGALIMAVADRFAKQDKSLTIGRGFVAGLFQTLALVPGISRSGATISGGLLAGFTRENAARFSFLLSVPILLGSGLKKLYDLWSGGLLTTEGFSLLIGSVIAFASGMLAIHFLISYLKRHDMTVFVLYRVLLAVVLLAFL